MSKGRRLGVLMAVGLGSLVLLSPATAQIPEEANCPHTITFAIVVEEGVTDRATVGQLLGTISGRVGKIEPKGCHGALVEFFFDTNPFTDENPSEHGFDIVIAIEKSPLWGNAVIWFLSKPFEEAREHVVEAVKDERIRAKAEELLHNRVLDARDPLGAIRAELATQNGWIGGDHGH
jgi:hypothetical protein